jgi:hypothetical protein
MNAPLRRFAPSPRWGDETSARAKPVARSPWAVYPPALAFPAEKPIREHQHG